MSFQLSLTVVAASIAMTLSAVSFAAQPVDLQKQAFAQTKKTFGIQFPGMTLHSGQHNQLTFLKQHVGKNTLVHVRLQQTYNGFPVFGGYAIAHSKHSGMRLLNAPKKSVKMTGKIYKGIEADVGAQPRDFTKNKSLALQQFLSSYSSKKTSEAEVIPMIYIDDHQQAHWAYKVSVFVEHVDKIPSRPTAVLDAKNFKPFVEWDNVKTERMPAKATGFGGNKKVGKVQYNGFEFSQLDITRDAEQNRCYLENSDVRVVDMEHRYSSNGQPMEFYCVPVNEEGAEDNLFWTGYLGDGSDEINGAFSPTNDALYAGQVIKRMYQEWYGEEALTNSDGSPMQLVMRVHYGDGYENAYWDGKKMTFGDGESMMYPLVSLGVGGHEISHGFTEQHANLNYYGQSGGINEAFSDMAAMAAEVYSVGKASWQIGAEIMKEDSGYDALRYMDDPSKDGMSINSADDYYGGLDVHYSSGVYNHLFYLLANTEGWSTRKAFDVMVLANMAYWTPYTNFKDGGCGILNAAADLDYDMADVRSALTQVAIQHDDCVTE